MNRADPLLVLAAEQAYRPVTAKHQPLRAERFQRRFPIRAEEFRVPIAVANFSYHTGKLTRYVLPAGKFPDIRSPLRIELIFGDDWFGNVIQHERLLRVAIHELDGHREVVMIDQDIIDKSVRLQLLDAPIERSAQEKHRIWLVLHHMAHSFEKPRVGPFL
ncbi:MAG: hypothetical protein KatS3mg111_3543 [Pirellulaceae bacterium]|nr:MAG: hypothetical protein KatS3mg111_3543 [Pirellulaceae bacterium]